MEGVFINFSGPFRRDLFLSGILMRNTMTKRATSQASDDTFFNNVDTHNFKSSDVDDTVMYM